MSLLPAFKTATKTYRHELNIRKACQPADGKYVKGFTAIFLGDAVIRDEVSDDKYAGENIGTVRVNARRFPIRTRNCMTSI